MRNTLTLGNTAFDEIMRDLNRFAVGFEPTFKIIDNIRNTSSSSGFPPYDLEQVSDNHYRLSMAVAGYGPDDLDITQSDGLLTVEGKVNKDENKTYLYKGIAGRSFKRSFYLNQWVRVTGSTLENGILVIDFVQEVPEALKPRKISITSPVTQSPQNVIDV
jgi:molecular chaperone IbpA